MEIPAEKLTERPTMLWSLSRYDGPLDGVALYQGKLVYFSTDQVDATWKEISKEEYQKLDPEEREDVIKENGKYEILEPRVYRLYELSPEQAEELTLQQDMRLSIGHNYGDHRAEAKEKKVVPQEHALEVLREIQQRPQVYYHQLKVMPNCQFRYYDFLFPCNDY